MLPSIGRCRSRAVLQIGLVVLVIVGFFGIPSRVKVRREPRFRTWTPASYQAAASNHSIAFATGYIGRNRMEAVIAIAPNQTGPSHAFAFTTRETEEATGFGTRAAAAHWKVIYLSEDVFPQFDPDVRLNYIIKQARTRPSAVPDYQRLHPDFVVWCDNKYAVNEAALWPVLASPRGPEAALWMFQHPFLVGGAETEMDEAMYQPRYAAQRQRVDAYFARVRSLGLRTEDASLTHYGVGVQVWDLRHPDAVRLQETWWEHIMECGLEDQVSFFVVQQMFPFGTVRKLPGRMTRIISPEPFKGYDSFADMLA